MKISFKQKGLDVNKNIYECSICGNLFSWNKESMWYGSDWQVENKPERIKYFCSEKCAAIWRNIKNKTMTKEEILIWALNNRCKYESSKEMDFDTHLAIMDAMEAYTHEQTEKYRELIEWLNDECPTVCPPLEPYTTADLSHDFAEILRTKLDDLK